MKETLGPFIGVKMVCFLDIQNLNVKDYGIEIGHDIIKYLLLLH